ncbi:hypothetical protein [Myceligenerans pegani]|uniref:Uncharacterized protein n=1 Tax=Myceligenerans pegani TaxID=2776917 RepID=A0ABR9N329_9MICO|nr:hypothetical protein [Myceligenerans sp. TRM 65318]MBE1878055.1 hypothetical protein [Myceligenerans sp. TRM 65318]MBE3020326.1 hypothetical protein [Myceligenerans sp. TRM 65318]
MDRDNVGGREWDFLALDRAGAIALISSAGYGLIPKLVLNHGRSVETAVAALQVLPVIGESLDRRGGDRSGDYSDWFEASRRGLYTYDWQLLHGPYERVSVPSVMLRASEVDPEIAQAAGLLRLPVRFAETAPFTLDGYRAEPYQDETPA